MSSLQQQQQPPATHLSTLPAELALATAKYLDRLSLKALALVSRKLHDVAFSILFATVTLMPDSRSARSFEKIARSESVQPLVKSVIPPSFSPPSLCEWAASL